MPLPVSRLAEYAAVLGATVSGTLWVGHVADQGTATAQAVAGLSTLPTQVAALDERTKAINRNLEDIKKTQEETQRLIIEAMRAKSQEKGKK